MLGFAASLRHPTARAARSRTALYGAVLLWTALLACLLQAGPAGATGAGDERRVECGPLGCRRVSEIPVWPRAAAFGATAFAASWLGRRGRQPRA
jgi:hypothetical protein